MASFQYQFCPGSTVHCGLYRTGADRELLLQYTLSLNHEDKALTQCDPLSLNLSTELIDIITELAVRIKNVTT